MTYSDQAQLSADELWAAYERQRSIEDQLEACWRRATTARDEAWSALVRASARCHELFLAAMNATQAGDRLAV